MADSLLIAGQSVLLKTYHSTTERAYHPPFYHTILGKTIGAYSAVRRQAVRRQVQDSGSRIQVAADLRAADRRQPIGWRERQNNAFRYASAFVVRIGELVDGLENEVFNEVFTDKSRFTMKQRMYNTFG